MFAYNHIDTIKEEDKLELTVSPAGRVERFAARKAAPDPVSGDIGSTGAGLRSRPLIAKASHPFSINEENDGRSDSQLASGGDHEEERKSVEPADVHLDFGAVLSSDGLAERNA